MNWKLCINKQSNKRCRSWCKEIDNPTNVTLKITDTKLYVPVVTLSTEDDNKLLEQLRTGFKRTIKWNKYRSVMTNQTQNNNLLFDWSNITEVK